MEHELFKQEKEKEKMDLQKDRKDEKLELSSPDSPLSSTASLQNVSEALNQTELQKKIEQGELSYASEDALTKQTSSKAESGCECSTVARGLSKGKGQATTTTEKGTVASPAPAPSAPAKKVTPRSSKSAASPRVKKNRKVDTEDAPDVDKVSEQARLLSFNGIRLETYHVMIDECMLVGRQNGLRRIFLWDTRVVKNTAEALTFHLHHDTLPQYWLLRLIKQPELKIELAYSQEYDGVCTTVFEGNLDILQRKAFASDVNEKKVKLTILNTRIRDQNNFKLSVKLFFKL